MQTSFSTKVETVSAEESSARPRLATAEEMLENSRALFESRELDLAARLLTQALQDFPENEKILELASVVFLEINQAEKALHCAVKYLEISDNRSRGHVLIGDAFAELQENESALQSYQYFLNHAKSDDEQMFSVLKSVGNIFVKQKDFEGAEEYYCKAFGLNPESDGLLINFGVLDIQRGKWNEARERFRNAIEINAKNDRAWVGLALVHRAFADFDLSWANLVCAIDLNANNSTAVSLLFEWAAMDGRHSELASLVARLRNRVSSENADLLCQSLREVFQRIGVAQNSTMVCSR